ncbi:ankyrin repeat and socs box-containing 8 [Plakobranchus ocellatus]|uniref:Ankyrin repeat and socs box-containing 8 n=1 Tax=Plakobranchus ocellatus TaxID=259542 RepID=A0AAV4A4K8_9GAST|nr:ankyrin repeat and socs box-containing 8 [Plakobranchus ocellatus]
MTSLKVLEHHDGEEKACYHDVITRPVYEQQRFCLSTALHTKSMKAPLVEEFLQAIHLPGFLLSAAGKPALHYAIRSRPGAILPLVRAGCEVMTPDAIHKDTSLHVACFHGLLDVIVFLVQCGACVNALNSSGQTPLDKLLSLCQHPSKNSNTRTRLIIAHLLTRMGFKVNPKAQGQKPGPRARVLHSYYKAKRCSDCPSLLHLSRLRVRESLPTLNLEPAVASLPVPVDLQDFLLFRPCGLDHHVTCSHVQDIKHCSHNT